LKGTLLTGLPTNVEHFVANLYGFLRRINPETHKKQTTYKEGKNLGSEKFLPALELASRSNAR
jgi:hypothetical protein